MGTRTPNFGLYKPETGEGSKQDPYTNEVNSNWDTVDQHLGGGAAKLYIQNDPPSNPNDGEVWIDTS